MITSICDSAEIATTVIAGLRAEGIDREKISILVSESEVGGTGDPEATKQAVEHQGPRALNGARLGAIVGAAGLAAGAVFALPGILAIGPLAALMFGAATGSVSGAMLGSLIGLGVSRDVAEIYQRSLEGGAVLLGCEVPLERGDAIEAKLVECGARSLRRVEFDD